MTSPNWKTLEGTSGREDTAITLRSIREILAESDEPAELLTSKDTQPAEAADAPADAPAQQAAKPHPEADAQPDEVAPASFSARLTRRIFGG